MGEVKINTIIPFFTNILSILIIFISGYYYGLWGVIFARMNNVVISIFVRTYTYNKVFNLKDYFIGLKMVIPILVSIVITELIYYNFF